MHPPSRSGVFTGGSSSRSRRRWIPMLRPFEIFDADLTGLVA
jgi:hypothetical protein